MEQYYPFRLEPLDYRFNDLEPYLDLQTVLLHYGNHQQNYVNQLNDALSFWPLYQEWSLTQLLRNPSLLPLKLQIQVRQSGGGVFNHQFYFDSITPASGQQPSAALEAAIRRDFGSMDAFRRQFMDAADRVFGSGWVWLVADPFGRMRIITTRDQETPLAMNLTPLLAVDLWEHAYYLQYKNHRTRYLDSWWNLINWQKVGRRYQERMALG